MAESLQAIRRRLEQRDAQSEQLVRTQISGLDTNYNNGISQLDAEKEQAFGDITTQANANGQAFTGAGIFNQRQYLGTKYLPGRQQLLSERENNRFKLQGTLADYARQRSQDAEELRNSQLKAEYEDQREREKMAMERERIAISRQSAANRASRGTKMSAWEAKALQQGGFIGDLARARQELDANPTAYQPGTRERIALHLAQKYGVEPLEARKQAYAVFDDGWDNAMRSKYKAPNQGGGGVNLTRSPFGR